MEHTLYRENGLDILRCICTFLVLSIHFPLEVRGGNYLAGLARVAVPLFLVFTGYFYQNTAARGRETAQLKKMAMIFLGGNLLYFVWRSLCYGLEGSLGKWLSRAFSPAAIVNFVFKNESPFSVHLWYLGAAFYVLVVIYFCRKFHLMRWLCRISPLLILANVCCGTWSTFLFGRTINHFNTRNFLFVGLPFFCMGWAAFACREKLEKAVKGKALTLFVLIGLLTALNCLEQMFLFRNDFLVNKDLYFVTPFLAFALFLWFGFGPARNLQGGLWDLLAAIGRKYSLTIYLLQSMMNDILFPIIRACGLTELYLKLHAVVVFAACLCVAVFVEKLKKRSLQ